MIRNLTIIAVASFVLAVGCFAGAAAFGGRDLAKGHWTMPMNWRVHVDEANDTFSIEPGDHLVSQDASPEISRTVAWTGADSLQLDVPADMMARVQHRYYDAGHMMYTRQADLVQLKADVAAWWAA